jgi:hypothetical protein
VGGLEGALPELVTDGGSVVELGDPRVYADELRAAAGLERSLQQGVAGTAPWPLDRPSVSGWLR